MYAMGKVKKVRGDAGATPQERGRMRPRRAAGRGDQSEHIGGQLEARMGIVSIQ